MNSIKTSNVENLQTDIVIVGGGGAGLAAAIAAKEKGVKDVIVLEARNTTGGNATMVHGIFGAESPAQKRLGINVNRDELFRQHMDYGHWKLNGRLVRAVIDKSGDTIRWLEEKGLRFDRIVALFPPFPPLFHQCGSKFTGGPLMKALAKNCEDLGVKVLRRSAGKKLLTDEKGNVTGVVAKAGEKELRVTAKCVIIATGGCAGNKELLKKYYPNYSENVVLAGLPHKGDGLLMATEIGAATAGLGTLEGAGPDFLWLKSPHLNWIAWQPNTLWVNKRGERFTDEGVATRAAGDSANTILGQPDQNSYTLYDVKIKRSLTEEGLAGGPPGWLWGVTKFVWEKDELPELEKEFQKQEERGILKISDSWDEIAGWMGATPGVLKATVDEYNSFCDQGYDEIFAKERKYLVPLRTPPYYAMKCGTHFYCTKGGLKINEYMEVLNQQDNPIPGLYAVGGDTGGWEADTYNIRLAGHSVGFAVNSGRIAGETTAKRVLGK